MTSDSLLHRKHLLLKLLNFSDTIEIIKSELRQFSWDSDVAIVECNRKHLINILNRYQHHEISNSEVEEWANLIECREDIDFQAGWEELISEIIYKMANPELEGILTEPTCLDWLERLSVTG